MPQDGHVLFANTGKEHEATLNFVHEIERRWCPITWIERRQDTPKFAVVNFDSADRTGKHFKDLIVSKQRLPSPPQRFCTSELKVIPMERYLKSLGLSDFTAVLGIRYDEPRRVSRIRGMTDRDISIPLADARIDEQEILAYWKQSEFDLPWPHDQKYFGNCDLCFLKSLPRLRYVLEARPELADWWIEMEEMLGYQFRNDRPAIKTLRTQLTIEGKLFECAVDDSLPCDCTE